MFLITSQDNFFYVNLGPTSRSRSLFSTGGTNIEITEPFRQKESNPGSAQNHRRIFFRRNPGSALKSRSLIRQMGNPGPTSKTRNNQRQGNLEPTCKPGSNFRQGDPRPTFETRNNCFTGGSRAHFEITKPKRSSASKRYLCYV